MDNQFELKHKELNLLWQEYKDQLLDLSFHHYRLSISELRTFVQAYQTRFEKLKEIEKQTISRHTQLRSFSKSVLELLSKTKESLTYNSESFIASYDSRLKEISKSNSLTLSRKEIFKAYSLRSNRNLPLFIKKAGANFMLSFRSRRRKIANIFLKMLKKDLLDVQSYRLRKIPFRNMLALYLGPEFEKLMLNTLQELLKAKSEISIMIWDFDESLAQRIQSSMIEGQEIDFTEVFRWEEFDEFCKTLETKIDDLNNLLLQKTEENLLDIFERFDTDLAIVDTPDLPAGNFRKSILQLEREKNNQAYQVLLSKWENTHRALHDDWTIDVEVMYLYFSVLDEFGVLYSQINDYINENLSLNLGKLHDFILKSAETIDNKDLTSTELRKILVEERKRNSQEFVDKILAKTINKLSGEINLHLEEFNDKTMSFVEQVSDNRAFVKSRNYLKETKSSEISWLSPRDLLRFEALPHFRIAIEEVEEFVSSHLEKARMKLIALGTVSDFSLESAQMMLAEKKSAVKGSQQVVSDGYKRALIHLDEAEAFMNNIKVEPLKNLQAAINNFNTEIQKLKNIENVVELQMKIVRIRAVERSKRIRQEAWDWVIHFIPKTRAFFKTQFESTNVFIQDVKKRMGMSAEKPHISHELSDFLRKTEKSLKKLPFVYQRLYQLTPTDEERFFVGRQKELESLNEAFENWQNDRFITTAIIGEKGGGISSLILFFLKSIDPNFKVIHKELSVKIHQPEDYYQFFAQAFEQDSFASNDEIIQFINKRKSKSIFIIENMQHMYLKVVKGFGCQKMFFDLITSTWKKMFWIGAYTTHSWEYLEKTLHISSIFTLEIELEKFTDETLEEIIFKRNYLSGYKIEFQVSELNLSSKSLAKLDEKGKQDYLKKTFFKELNQMSNGNVSLAQLYWLRSTHGIEEEVIKIQSLRDFDVSFDKDLPSNYLFALHAILVHDGLVISDYAHVFNLPEYACRNDLTPMLEKGLLIKPKDKYNINPIIFRQVIDMLRSHNFIN